MYKEGVIVKLLMRVINLINNLALKSY